MPIFRAPAKLNLFLHVVGRRADGYHLIQSAMRLIDLEDTVTIELRDDGRIERAGEVAGVELDADLALRAARLLQAEARSAFGATISIDKRIPIGGGLGGGSSDAATTLLALNHLWSLGWGRTRLAVLGLRLGADVPFFVGCTDSFVEGIGERLSPIALRPAFYVVVHPGVSVPTAVVFGSAELTRDTEVLRISDFSESGSSLESSSCGISRSFGNDLEPVAAALFPPVRNALDWLDGASGGTDRARMSGSGACVFRTFDSKRSADDAVTHLPEGWAAWSVASLAEHPHRDFASD